MTGAFGYASRNRLSKQAARPSKIFGTRFLPPSVSHCEPFAILAPLRDKSSISHKAATDAKTRSNEIDPWDARCGKIQLRIGKHEVLKKQKLKPQVLRRLNRCMMKKLLPIFLLVFFTMAASGQQPDRWRGLILNESTPNDALKLLGKADKDESSQPLRVFGGVSRWLTKRQKEKIFRVIEFKLGKEQGVQKAVLYFLEDKLVRIMLDLKAGEVSPNGLGTIYGLKLLPMVGALDIAMSPADYERNQGNIYPKSYPTVYYLVGMSEKSFVSGMVGNSSFGSILAKSMGVLDQPNSFPGKVEYIDLISRVLENRDGTDILK